MARMNQPSAHLMIQGLQAAPCFAGRGHINKRQQNSGHQLQKKDGESGAAEHVEPTRRIARHGMFRPLRESVLPAASDGRTIRQFS